MKSISLFFREVAIRWKAESPTFWKRVRRIFASAMLVAGGSYGLLTEFAADLATMGVTAPDWLLSLTKVAAVASAAVALMTKLTVVDSDLTRTEKKVIEQSAKTAEP